MLIKKVLTRRQILSRLGGVGAVHALTPFVPMIEAAEGDGTKKRFAYWHEFVMPQASLVDPNYQTEYGPLDFKNGYASLNSIKDKLIFIRKMARPQGQGKNGGPHPAGSHAISGWRYGGRTGNKISIVNPNAHSMDQFLSEKLEGVTPYGDLRAGTGNNGKNGVIDRGTSIKKGQVQTRYQSPTAMYNEIFKGAAGASSGNNAAAEALLRRNKSVLDFMRGDIERVKNKVSQMDRQRIDSHVEAIRRTETKLEAQANNTCEAKAVGGGGGLDGVYSAYGELMTQALTCDLTRVIGAAFGSATNTLSYGFLPRSNNFHQATHGKGGGPDFIRAVLKFRAEEVTKYLKLLDSVVEPDGNTLLDNTLFSWFTDVSRNHDTTGDIHCILAGGKGRFKGHGQMVEAGPNEKYNQLLGSMAHYMGYEVEGYGDPEYGGTGILSTNLFE